MNKALIAVDVGFGAIKVVASDEEANRITKLWFPASVQIVPNSLHARRPKDILKQEKSWCFSTSPDAEECYLVGVGIREMNLESRKQFSLRVQALVLVGVYRALKQLGILAEKNKASLVLGVPPGIQDAAKGARWPDVCYINSRPFWVGFSPVYIVSQTAGTAYLLAQRPGRKEGRYVFCDIGFGTTDIITVDITPKSIVAINQESYEVGCNEIENRPPSEQDVARQNVANWIANQVLYAIRQQGLVGKEVAGVVLTGGGSVYLYDQLSRAIGRPLIRIGNTAQEAVFANAYGMWMFLRDKAAKKA